MPGIEANQGLISIVALILALVVAMLEYRRALDTERKRVSEFRSLVTGLLDELIAEANRQIAAGDRVREALGGNAIFPPWRRLADKTHKAFETIRPTAPPRPQMLLVLLDIEDAINPNRGAPFIIELANAKASLAHHKTTLTELRKRFLEA